MKKVTSSCYVIHLGVVGDVRDAGDLDAVVRVVKQKIIASFA